MFPLFLWKELRECAPAIVFGVLWILGAVAFWPKALGLAWPHWADDTARAATTLAPVGCIVLLGAGRLFQERHCGSWDFLRTQPVPVRRVVALKWAVALALGMTFMALSSGIAWWPMSRAEEHVRAVSPALWIAFHAAALALFLSLLQPIDTVDWSEWLGTRAVVTAAAVVAFMMWIMDPGRTIAWALPAELAAGAFLCAGIAIGGAPWLAGESPLPIWRLRGSARVRCFNSLEAAWLWSEWRRLRGVALLLTVWMPLLFAAVLLIQRRYMGPQPWLLLLRQAIDVVDGTLPFALFVSATVLGFITFVESLSGTTAIRRTLPIGHLRALVLRVLFALVLYVATCVPALAISLASDLWITGQSPVILVGWLLIGAAVLLATTAAGVAFPPLAPFVALGLMVFTGNLAMPTPISGATTAALFVGAVILVIPVPRLAWRREV